jgi:hypothetical protein
MFEPNEGMKLVCSGVQNLHCSQTDCPHWYLHVESETCKQTFCEYRTDLTRVEENEQINK